MDALHRKKKAGRGREELWASACHCPGRLYLAIAIQIVLPMFFAVAATAQAGTSTRTSAGTSTEQDAISHLVQQIKDLQQHDRDLEERIKILEANQKGVASPEPTASAPAVAAPAEAQVAAPLPEVHLARGIQWRGFAEVDYKVLNQAVPETGFYGFVPGSAGNFYTGDFGLFLTARLTDKASVLSEIDFQEADAQSFAVNLRRMLLKYDINDHLKLSFGRYQTSDGYYNWAFRSAAWLQTTADRPLVMEFAQDGGILPTQAVGVSVSGAIPSGRLGLNYVAEYGLDDTIRPDINGDGLRTDENNGNQVNLALFLRPEYVRGLRIGGSIAHDQISNLNSYASGGGLVLAGGDAEIPNEFSARWNQTIVNGHIVYVSQKFEFLNEGFLIRHALIGDSSAFKHNTPAFYSQVSRKVGLIRPFFRYQYVNASPLNIIYDDVGLRYGPSFGFRYDLNDYFAFKAQLDRTSRRGLPDLDGLHFQIAATF